MHLRTSKIKTEYCPSQTQNVVDAINEAYSNCELKLGTRNTYQGVANNGMKIDMFLDQSGKIISAFPEE